MTLLPDDFSTIGLTFLDRKVHQLLRERNLSEQIVDPMSNGTTELPFFVCFVKLPVTAGRTQKVAREQMGIVKSMTKFAGKCFESYTEDYKDIREATPERLPVFLSSSGNQNIVLYRNMAEEFRLKFTSP